MSSGALRHLYSGALLWMFAFVALASCGEDPTPLKSMNVRLYGWGPNGQGSESFMEGLPAYEGAEFVRVSLTKPRENRVLDRQTGPIVDRTLKLPELSYGAGYRIEMEILNNAGQTVATGSTPLFDFLDADPSRALRVMMMPVNRFAPAGSIELDANNERKFVQSRFDYRVESALEQQGVRDAVYLGRVGHVAVPTSDGKVLIVGGADVIPGSAPGTIPKFRQVHRDVQLFDPETGYFSDLSYDEDNGRPFEESRDRLIEGRAFHTVTPIGDDKFLVVGGYTEIAGNSRPVRALELIDLKAAPGSRINELQDFQGLSLTLNKPRGFHTAVHRPQSNQVIIIGGIGQSSDEILDSIEVINLESLQVLGQTFSLKAPRTEHASVLLGDGSIWVIGGRNTTGVLSSTERVEFSSLNLSVTEEVPMKKPRFGFGAVTIREGTGTRVLVVGGFTSLEGAVTGEFEVGISGRDFFSDPKWSLAKARGAMSVVELPQSKDIVVVGGQDKDRETISDVERLVFQGLSSSSPYQVVSESMGAFKAPRLGASVSMMTSGQILVTGGIGVARGTVIALDNAELYNPYDPVAGGLFLE